MTTASQVPKMVQRIQYRRRHSYNTRSNKVKKVRTPGGATVYQYVKKAGHGPKCADCGIQLPGIPQLRPKEYHSISKRRKTVTRAYGGNSCAKCVRNRIVRAFLIEEQKIVKAIQSKKAGKKSKKAQTKRR
mmetsp:Transcript_57434/g.79718  ORF Transcript_57434/g.79718 Transcript_57434/m.79718 type:complete len:131 (+) Transcript_57434:1-393(+)